jgi:hypothetical protein
MNFSLGVRTSSGTDAAAAWEIRTGATPGRAKIMEIGIFLAAATASVFGIGRPAAIGDTPTVQSALAWGTGPTVPAAFLRRISLPATIGTGVIFSWPQGLTIPVSSSIVLWNLGTNAVVDAYAVVEI